MINAYHTSRALLNARTLVLLIALIPSLAFSAEPDLYMARIAVVSQSAGERKPAIIKGLRQVLVKKTGSRSILSTEGINQILRRSQTMLISFSYTTTPDQLWLDIKFDKDAVDSSIQDLNQTIWLGERSGVLVWLLNRENITVHVANNDDIEMRKVIENISQERAIPAFLPLMDINEQMSVDLRATWGGFTETIEHVSANYDLPYTLLGRIRNYINQDINPKTGLKNNFPEWQIQWTLLGTKEPIRWTTQATDKLTLIHAGLQSTLDKITFEHAIRLTTNDRGNIQITISGLYDRQLFQAALNELREQELIKTATLVNINRERITVELELNGPLETTIQLLIKGGKFKTLQTDSFYADSRPQNTTKIDSLATVHLEYMDDL